MAVSTDSGSGFADGNGVRLHYIVLGTGSRPLLAFHGYGQSAVEFRCLEGSLGKEYKIYSFSLFFHGRSDYSLHRINKTTFRKHELRAMFHRFFEKEGIDRFSLAGYSIGGKLAMVLSELFPEKVDDLFLFSPDGLKPNRLVRFVTFNRAGKYLYKKFVAHPGIFHLMIRLFAKLRIIDLKMRDFILANTATAEQRMRVFRVWMSFRHLEPDRRLFGNLMKEYPVNLQMFFGKFDRIITPKLGRKFLRKINRRGMLHIIYTGHKLLTERTQKYLLKHPEIWRR